MIKLKKALKPRRLNQTLKLIKIIINFSFLFFLTTGESCDKSFTTASALKRHVKGVHENIKQKGPRDYRCKLCKEVFSNKYQKEKHLAQVHLDGAKPLRSCRLCQTEFELFDDFKQHLSSHQLPFICLICGENNSSQEALNEHNTTEHKRIDEKLRRFFCDVCGHRLFNKIQLKVHMRKHMLETSFYVCDICGQSYRFIAPFLYHKKVHEGKKDFVSFEYFKISLQELILNWNIQVCSDCGKKFLRKTDLTIHIRSHTQEKPFK